MFVETSFVLLRCVLVLDHDGCQMVGYVTLYQHSRSCFLFAGGGCLPSLRDVAVDGAELLLPVLEVPVLDPARRSTTVNSYRDLPQFLHVNADLACQIRPRLLPSKSPPFHSELIILYLRRCVV